MEKLAALKMYFGHDAFRPGQEPLIDALLQGRDALGVMPTGAGKSMCYQIPALMLEGTALVVSPLISLMKDQVAALIANGVRAAYLNSSLTPGQMERALENARQGLYKIIYVAPERLDTAGFLRFAQQHENFPHRRGRGALRQPMGPGFPPQLSEDCRLCGVPAHAAAGGRVHGHGDASGPGGYSSPASAGKSAGVGDGL